MIDPKRPEESLCFGEKQQSEGKMANTLRAITSNCVNFCKIEKGSLFTHFGSKNTHISGCKIIHLCTIATVTVHICTVTVALLFIILYARLL